MTVTPDLRGLSSDEASERLVREGPNALPSEARTSVWATVGQVIREPMVLLLVTASVIYVLLGDRLEAIMLSLSVAFVVTIELVQERKTQGALDALRDLTSPRALVIRDGQPVRIPGYAVVTGDILVLSEGDRVAADATLLDVRALLVDESLLTGESAPVNKRVTTGGEVATHPGGDDLPFVYSGTLVVKGRGTAVVTATGVQSVIGKIGNELGSEPPASPLSEEVGYIARIMAVDAVALSLALAAVQWLHSGDFTGGILAGIALAMSLLPEELPIILTVFLAIGALRLSRTRVLTRRMAAIETLGSASVLCTDKTGTLTENRMTVSCLYRDGIFAEVRGGVILEPALDVLEHGILASPRDPFDPMDIAFHRLGGELLNGGPRLHPGWQLVREYPLSSELLAMGQAWRPPGLADVVISVKGAPEAVAAICRLTKSEAEDVRRAVETMASRGLRVLGVATATAPESALPDTLRAAGFHFLGLAGLEDPVRAAVPDAVAQCRAAGIRVLMITGDYPQTAAAIARVAGLENPDRVLTGAELASLNDEELGARLEEVDVIARAVPEQKLRIVRALAADGHVVAMTGDGVNDAPALEAAHIGVAMGGRGTDVAREAADLIVTDDDFASIVAGIRLGRRIFDNLRKAVVYIVAIHVPIAGVSLFPALLGWPLVLLPLHIVFLELIIDPACSVAFEAEPEEADVMTRPPRAGGSRLIDRRVVLTGVTQGLTVLIAAFALVAVLHVRGYSEGSVRAAGFAAVVGGNIALILTNLEWAAERGQHPRRRNRIAMLMMVGSVMALCATLLLPPLRGMFRFDAIPVWLGAGAFALGFISPGWFEAAKRQGYFRLATPKRRVTPDR